MDHHPEQVCFFTNVTENLIRKHTVYISQDSFNVNAYPILIHRKDLLISRVPLRFY